jgi:hypothetical protein
MNGLTFQVLEPNELRAGQLVAVPQEGPRYGVGCVTSGLQKPDGPPRRPRPLGWIRGEFRTGEVGEQELRRVRVGLRLVYPVADTPSNVA